MKRGETCKVDEGMTERGGGTISDHGGILLEQLPPLSFFLLIFLWKELIVDPRETKALSLNEGGRIKEGEEEKRRQRATEYSNGSM